MASVSSCCTTGPGNLPVSSVANVLPGGNREARRNRVIRRWRRASASASNTSSSTGIASGQPACVSRGTSSSAAVVSPNCVSSVVTCVLGAIIGADSSTGLAVDLRVRMLVMHQAEGFRERGMAVSLSYNPTPSTPLGLVARVAPSWGGQATSGAEALWGRETMGGMSPGGVASGNRLDGEVGYGLPVGSRFVGTPRVGFSTSEYGRDYRAGYGLGLLNRGSLSLELGIDAQRRESPLQGAASNGVLGRATLGW